MRELDVLKRKENQPEQCWQIVPSDESKKPIVIKFGQNGYNETTYDGPWSKEILNKMNKKLGVTEAQAEAMMSCSISGLWDKYDEFVKSHSK